MFDILGTVSPNKLSLIDDRWLLDDGVIRKSVILIKFNDKSVGCTVVLNMARDNFFNILFCFG